jgi:type II restriction enzyme
MTINDLIELYEAKRRQYGNDVYYHISELLREAKEKHRKDFLQSNTAQRAIEQGRIPDHEQSWRAFKGNQTFL